MGKEVPVMKESQGLKWGAGDGSPGLRLEAGEPGVHISKGK